MINLLLYKRVLYLLQLAAVIWYPFVKLLQFPFNASLLAALVVLMLFAMKKNLAAIGFKKIAWKDLVNKAFFGFFIIRILFDFIIQPAINLLFNSHTDLTAYQFLKDNTAGYLMYLLYAWINTAFAEEIIYRGFLVYAAEKITRNKWMACLLSAIVFSIAHLQHGWSSMLAAFFLGALLSVIYFKSGRNILVCIISHGLVDTLFLTMAYKGNLHYFESPFEFFKHLSCI